MHGATRRLRPHEATALEPLREQAQPVAIGPQQLDQIATLAAEHKHVTAVRVGRERRLDECGEPLVAVIRLRDVVSLMTVQPPARVVRWAGRYAVVANW